MLTDAEIAGYMGWRGPGAYTEAKLLKIKSVIAEAVRREREELALRFNREPTEQWWGIEVAEAIRAGGEK